MATPPVRSIRVAQLAAIPMLSTLTQSQLEKIADAGDERIFHVGETILRQGEKGLGLYLMLSGTADVRRSGQKVASLSAGQFFGESALLVDEPRTADVFCITEVSCFVLNRWDFWGAVGIDPQVDQTLYNETVARLKSFQSQLIE
ncbi:MAG: cyclic nucleotide-binding domain-containing protein [Thermoplasmata archaeon]